MTALSVIVTPDAAHVLTDGSVQHRDGAADVIGTAAQMGKAFPIPHAGAVYAARGSILLTPAVFLDLNLRADLDDIIDRLPASVRSISAATAEAHKRDIGPSDHLVAGWSEKRRRFTAFLFTLNPNATWAPGGGMTEIEGVFISPPVPLGTYDELDVPRIGLDIMRAQREGDPIMVGGFAQMTSVYRDRIEARILERWPERLGQRIAA